MAKDIVIFGGPIFDGKALHTDRAALFRSGVLEEIVSSADAPEDAEVIDLKGQILSPGFVDLQVNGGGGLMFNDAPSVPTLQAMAEAHRDLGVSGFLPTLITATPECVTCAIDAVAAAIGAGMPGILGLHLEGPHLSVEKKGAHDAALVRAMTDADVAELLAAKARLPVLMVTVAPESVSLRQVAELNGAGIRVALGHTAASYETCREYQAAGASCATHLFNAMSQLGAREPGLVGAALTGEGITCGLIADGVHVHPAAMALAWEAKGRKGQIYLVGDAMSVAGTERDEFRLGRRRVLRRNGQLRLEDGTLAGADLALLDAVRVLVEQCSVDPASALAAATFVPAQLVGSGLGRLTPGTTRLADLIAIAPDLTSLRRM